MRRYTITVNDTSKVIDIEAVAANVFRVQIDGRSVNVELTDHRDLGHGTITPVITTRRAEPTPTAETVAGVALTPPPTSSTPSPSATPAARQASGAARDKLTAPMPGVILSITTTVGATVKRGDPLLVLEAMKMKNELRAPQDGVVAEIYVAAGEQVRFGDFLIRFA